MASGEKVYMIERGIEKKSLHMTKWVEFETVVGERGVREALRRFKEKYRKQTQFRIHLAG